MLTADADLVLMTGHVAQVFVDDEAWRVTLRHLHAALAPGGALAFATRNQRTGERSRTRDVLAFRGREGLHEALRGAGFAVGAEFGDRSRSPVTPSSPELTVIAHRVEPSGQSAECVAHWARLSFHIV